MVSAESCTRRRILWTLLVAGAWPAANVVAQKTEDVTLRTTDGVVIEATFYPSEEKKGATPVILLHDYKETRTAYHSMAEQLRSRDTQNERESFAVLTVDMRGHGDSTKQQLRNGRVAELDAAKFRKRDFEAMWRFDMEAVRRFLVTKNDEEKINLNKLSIVGAGLGANVATLWAAQDWSAPPLAIGKQGQDVKALVLVSPRWKNQGLLMYRALRQPGVQRMVAMMLIYGKDDKSVHEDVMRIKDQVERFHPEPESSADPPSDLVGLAVPNTRLQGGKLLSEVGDKAVVEIANFINTHVTQKEEYRWFQRRNRIP